MTRGVAGADEHGSARKAFVDKGLVDLNVEDVPRSKPWGCVLLVVAGGALLALASALAYGVARRLGANTVENSGLSLRSSRVPSRLLSGTALGDPRIYLYSKLANGLEVLNIEDNQSLSMAFAVAVNAGSFDNPKELPGLAHFCEHVLFLGTRTHPDPDEFSSFIAEHGGGSNAYTAEEVTVYYADVSRRAGKEGLFRFSEFFSEPMFDSEYVGKEVNAITSEHAKNIQSPGRRVMEVMRSLADGDSPMSRFATGDKKTLYDDPKSSNRDPVEALKTWFKAHYCPEQMHLVTFSADSVLQQLQYAIEGFAGIESSSGTCRAPRKGFSIPRPWPKESLQKWVHVWGTQPRADLYVQFVLPELTKKFREKPLDYIDYVLRHGGEHSLKRLLTDTTGLVVEFSVTFDETSAATSLFIQFRLSRNGIKHQQLVLEILFGYLAILRRTGTDKALYDSIAEVEALQWNWLSLDSGIHSVSDFAERMTRLPVDSLLSADSVIAKPDPALVESLVAMLVPENMNVAYVSPSAVFGHEEHEPAEGEVVKELDHYEGLKYSVQDVVSREENRHFQKLQEWLVGDISAERIRELLAKDILNAGLMPLRKLRLEQPKPIQYIPKQESLDMKHMRASRGQQDDVDSQLFGVLPWRTSLGEVRPGPYSQQAEFYYRSGWVSTSPKVMLKLLFRPLRNVGEKDNSALDEVNLEMYKRLLLEEITPKLVDLTEAATSYEVEIESEGIGFLFKGFPPTIPLLMSSMLDEINMFNSDVGLTPPRRFNRLWEHLREDLSVYSDMPIAYAIKDRNLILTKGVYSDEELLAGLKEVTPESGHSSMVKLMLSRPLQLTALAMGNLGHDPLQQAIGSFATGLRDPDGVTTTEASGEVERVTPIVSIAGPVELRAKNPRRADPNDAVVVSLVGGVATVEMRVLFGLLGQILNPLAYNELRTNKQLGYVVNSGVVYLSNILAISCVVQGQTLNADEMESAIQRVYTKLMPEKLLSIMEDEIDSNVHAFRQMLLTPPEKFSAEFEHFWGPVTLGGICFELQKEMLRYLDGLTNVREALVAEWRKLVTPTRDVRQKVVVKYFADSGEVPARPSQETLRASWAKEELSAESMALLGREYDKTTVMHGRANSALRQQLVDEGGYFPPEPRCQLGAASLSPRAPPGRGRRREEETTLATDE